MEELIAANRSVVRSVIKKMTGSYNEDIEQEVYIKAWRNLSSYQEKGKLGAWFAVITRNLCLDYFKSGQRRMQSLGEDAAEEIKDERLSPEEALTLKVRQKRILKAVDALPAKMRKVIELHEFEEMSCEDIALKLAIPVGTVKSRLFTARRILSEKLKDMYQDGKEVS